MKYILRTLKTDNEYVELDKRLLADTRLKWLDYGIMAYLLSRDDTAVINKNEIMNHSSLDGKQAFNKSFSRLIQYGYLKQVKVRAETGEYKPAEYYVFEVPELSETNG